MGTGSGHGGAPRDVPPQGEGSEAGEELTPHEESGADSASADNSRRERLSEDSMPHGHLPSLGEHQYGTLPQAPQECIGASMGGLFREVNAHVAAQIAAVLAGASGTQGPLRPKRR